MLLPAKLLYYSGGKIMNENVTKNQINRINELASKMREDVREIELLLKNAEAQVEAFSRIAENASLPDQ